MLESIDIDKTLHLRRKEKGKNQRISIYFFFDIFSCFFFGFDFFLIDLFALFCILLGGSGNLISKQIVCVGTR